MRQHLHGDVVEPAGQTLGAHAGLGVGRVRHRQAVIVEPPRVIDPVTDDQDSHRDEQRLEKLLLGHPARDDRHRDEHDHPIEPLDAQERQRQRRQAGPDRTNPAAAKNQPLERHEQHQHERHGRQTAGRVDRDRGVKRPDQRGRRRDRQTKLEAPPQRHEYQPHQDRSARCGNQQRPELDAELQPFDDAANDHPKEVAVAFDRRVLAEVESQPVAERPVL